MISTLRAELPTGRPFLSVALALIQFLAFHSSSALSAEIIAEGRAAGDSPSVREQALADALREAVRQGIGVSIISSTGVSDFALEYDRIFSSAFGHIRSYTVLEAGLGEDGIYRVKISAVVEEGAPDIKDDLALRQLAALKGSPRIALKISEKIEGVAQKEVSRGWFEEAGGDLRLNFIDVSMAEGQESKLAERDRLLGKDRSAAFREAGISQKADFLIEVNVNGRYVGKQSLYGGLPQHVFSMGAELRALRPETGEIFAVVNIPPAENLGSDLQNPEMAAVALTRQMLEGKPGDPSTASGWSLFRKILARWTTEIDLGRLIRIEVSGLGKPGLDRLLAGVRESGEVSAAFVREYDTQAGTIIDIETRLNAIDLGELVIKAADDTLMLDRSTDSYLLFATNSTDGDGLPDVAVDLSSSPEKDSEPPSAWMFLTLAVIGVAVLVSIMIVVLLGRKKS